MGLATVNTAFPWIQVGSGLTSSASGTMPRYQSVRNHCRVSVKCYEMLWKHNHYFDKMKFIRLEINTANMT